MYASGQTERLKLPQWREEDFARMEDFNEAFTLLDDYADTVNGQLEELRHDLTANLQMTNQNLLYLIAPDYYAGSYTGPMEAMVINRLDSAEETGTTTGQVWFRHPIFVGLGSRLLSGSASSPTTVYADVFDLGIRKTVAVPGKFTQATLIVQLWGCIPHATSPHLTSRSLHTEDYTGLDIGTAVTAALDGQVMTPAAVRDGVNPAGATDKDAADVKEYVFQLDAAPALGGEISVELGFHAPADHCMRIYNWALILA